MDARPDHQNDERTVGKAAFLGGLLGFVGFASLSVVGIGHARSIAGDANTQYWIVVAIAAAALGWVIAALARTPARTRFGEAARKVGVAAGAIWLVLFLWETAGVGGGAFSGPLELLWSAVSG